MFEDNQDPLRLLKIKSHIGFHGFGCAIVDDHVAIELGEKTESGDCACGGVRRVKSFDEACAVIGCRCGDDD